MKRFTTLAHAAVIAATLFGATAAFADPMPYTSILTASDPTQKGRISRGGVPQDESGGLPGIETFQGIINPTMSYHYHVYSIAIGAVDTLVEITMNSASTNTFVSAYQSAYYVTNPGLTWLGDAGNSGLSFGTDPQSFDFIAAANSTVLLVVNETTPNAGIGTPATNTFTLYAQELDYTYQDPNPIGDVAISNGGQVIPEPSTLLLLAPLALVAGLKSRRRRPASAALLAA